MKSTSLEKENDELTDDKNQNNTTIKIKLPKCSFDEEACNFDKTSFAQEIKLPPLDHVSKNKDIPYEEIKTNQYRNAAKKYSLKTDGNRLLIWIKALMLQYWKQLGSDPNYLINWTDKRPSDTRDEIQIDVDGLIKGSEEIDHRINTTIYLDTGTITVQGTHYKYFGTNEFPVLKQCVNKCSKLSSENKNDTSNNMTHTNTEKNKDEKALDNSQTTLKELKQTDYINFQEQTISDITIMNLVSQTDSLSDIFHTPAIFQENILDLDNAELHRCLAERTPKIKTKKNSDKEIKNLWKKYDNFEQSFYDRPNAKCFS
ncbi:unnamed protein product [Mytilus coruscus]|uniref:Uncharacterized protein n=1 Tax=Mytilus coruscus TaxID=42192 RepID=A0A6J8BLX4_MYTCO|nr:unnamed protein product [Mytilus coruscus]